MGCLVSPLNFYISDRKAESNGICNGPRCSVVQIKIERKHNFSGRGNVRVGD